MMDPTPLYHRIYLVLREQILDRKFAPDKPMPSENELASAYNVSRVTLRKTMERLEREGLVLRQRGRGTFAVPPASQTSVQADVSGLVENLLAMGLSTTVKVLEFEYTETPPDAAADMELEPGTVSQRAVRLRSLSGRPFSYAETYVREDIGRNFTAEDMETTPLLRLFELAGVKIASAHQRVTARAADNVVADLLGVEVGTPLLCIRRVVRDDTGAVIERIRALYRPDIYEFELNLTLGQGPDGTLWQPVQGTP
ncbi:GntR family transcriptional regulator [Jannaschia seohaensis]|uniref:GntR family transcriptional regulator n=1 Tax=Jannaschia seohaensis TaxID=475081 RepID=A0A2Y9AK27_9RHOB|nr:GntR family transcriptional regulator [Jannaschia seohaensis]PWJ20584.1 GntR family transcriptional regulator [Jannaschia seohaensis]SSA44680.1 GntR family transcriptional regulator [Jannaschia seohaensis]